MQANSYLSSLAYSAETSSSSIIYSFFFVSSTSAYAKRKLSAS